MSRHLMTFFEGRSQLFILFTSSILLVIIGFLDFFTGYDLSVGLFYLAPISILVWFRSKRGGYLFSFFSAGAWLLANSLTAPVGRLSTSMMLWNSGIRLGFFLIVASLLASLRAAHEREKSLARVDELTGVCNRRSFLEAAHLELLRAERLGYPISLIYVDIDNFKALNDIRGHGAGDELLRLLGRKLLQTLRATDIIGRLGGDEFVILLPNTNRETVALVSSKLSASLATAFAEFSEQLSASIGVITCNRSPMDVNLLIQAADTLMYEVKEGGKNSIRFGSLPGAP